MGEKVVRALLVDGGAQMDKLVDEFLCRQDSEIAHIVRVDGLNQALKQLKSESFDVVLLNQSVVESVELESLGPISDDLPDVPVIVLREDAVSLPSAIRGYFSEDSQEPVIPARGNMSAADLASLNQRIARLSALCITLGKISAAAAKSRDSLTLYEQLCKIMVSENGTSMAWAGMINESTGVLIPVAYAGVSRERMQDIAASIGNIYQGDGGPTGLCIQQGVLSICNDIFDTNHGEAWRKEAAVNGFFSVAAFPLKVAGDVVGAVTTYSDEPNFFHEEDFPVFEAVAADVARALDHMQREIDHRLADEIARSSESRYRELVDNVQEGLWAIDANFRTTLVNPYLQQMLGFKARSMLKKSIFDFMSDESAVTARACISQWDRDSNGSCELVLRRKDGTTVYAQVKFMPLKNREGKRSGFMAFISDISDRRGLEAQLRQSQRLEVLGTTVGAVAHEFKNLLMGISGYAEILQMKLGKKHSMSEVVNDMLSCVDRAGKLISQLHAFSKSHPTNCRPTDINALTSGSAQFLKRLVGEHITMDIDLCDTPAVASVTPDQIEQVLVNLVINARDAMPAGGRLTIRTRVVPFTKMSAGARNSLRPGNYLKMTVSDTGTGMDKNTEVHIFDPFFTTKESQGGTGLGLAVVYGIVKQHKGFIGVHSKVGVGTEFEVYLPLVSDSAVNSERVHPVKPKPGHETILFAEDEDTVRNSAKMVLEAHGYKVLCVADGQEAIEVFGEHPEIDIVVLDLVMPKMGGNQVWEAIQEMCPDMKVLFMSGYSDANVTRDYAPPSDAPLLTKPFSLFQLAGKVREILGDTGS